MAINDHLEDIALFFKKNGAQMKCWVTKDLYTDPNRRIEKFDPAWKGAIFTQGTVDAGSYYITNLSKLGSPGVPVEPPEKKDVPPPKAQPIPGQGDLVVIPYAAAGSAFLVKQNEYQDPKVCPDITPIEAADLAFLAVTEGVVLANIPKEDITGMSCYLLNLLGLTG